MIDPQEVADATQRLETISREWEIIDPDLSSSVRTHERSQAMDDVKLLTQFVRETMDNGSSRFDEVQW